MPKKTSISISEKFSILFLLFISIYIIYLHFGPVIDVLSGKEFNAQDFLINLTILITGLCALWGGFSLAKRSIAMEQLIDMGFENGVYNRLEPILKEIAGTQTVIDRMDERLNNMNINIDRLKKHSVELKIPGNEPGFGINIIAQISRFLRLIILINITLAVFIFLIKFTRSYTPFVLTMLYVLWWLEITYDYDQWKRSSAWWWVFIPILTIPVTTMIGDIIFGGRGDIVLGSMGIGLLIYASAYFVWSKYLIEGTLPFDLNRNIHEIPVDRKIIPYIVSSRTYLIRNHYRFGKILITISFISISLLIIQLFSVNIYYIKFLPTFSLDQFLFLGIFSVIFYILGVRLRHKKIENEAETV